MTTLKKADKAPNFSGLDQDGNSHQLSDYLGRKLVVFFYPKASTPGCTAEACDLRDNFERFEANNYSILGVSADAAKAQAKFKEKYSFPFPLLADEDKSVINAFGVWGPKKFMGKEYDGINKNLLGLHSVRHIIFYQIIDKYEIEVIRKNECTKYKMLCVVNQA